MITMSTRPLPELRPPTGVVSLARHRERRNEASRSPWTTIAVGRDALGGFLAVHRPTGRSYRIGAGTLAEAQAQVALLNQGSLELRA